MQDLVRRIEAEIPALRRYAWVLLHDDDQADDLVQDCLERALSRLRLWRRPGNLRAWLFAIMHNIHANRVRATTRHPAPLSLDELDYNSIVEDDQYAQTAAEQALQALTRLKLEQREVLLMVAVEGLRYHEIATTLGIPEGTVMSRLSRARERMRALTDDVSPQKVRRVE